MNLDLDMDLLIRKFLTEDVRVTFMRRMRGVICDAMGQLNIYFDCVYVDLFVINITQRLLQSVHCKIACVVRVALQ